MKDLIIGKIFESNNSGKFEVVDVVTSEGNKVYKVKFLETGYVAETVIKPKNGSNIKDYLRPAIHGVGCLGIFNENVNENYRKEYAYWERMLSRCYNENDKKYSSYGGNGVRVSYRWHRFEYFLSDIHNLDGWDKEKFYNNEISLDKDYNNYINGKNVYSKENCMWINSTKNYMYQPHKQKLFKLTSPDNSLVFYHFNLTEMARILDFMTRKGIEQAITRNSNGRHYGWKVEYVNSLPKGMTPYNINNQFENIKEIKIPLTPPSSFSYDGVLDIYFKHYDENSYIYFKAASPDGQLYYHYNMSEFARFFDKLSGSSISNVLCGVSKTHWGWKFEYVDKLPDGLTPLNINDQFNQPKKINQTNQK